MKIIVTGGAGFVGSNLSISLKRDNPEWDIVAVDNLYRKGSELNLPRLSRYGVRFSHGDIRMSEDIMRLGGCDLLLECSAEPSVLAGYDDSPSYLMQTNLVGFLNCIEACRLWQAGIIFLSSSRVYPIDSIVNLSYRKAENRFCLVKDQDAQGVDAAHGFDENFPLSGVRSLYGVTKYSAELVLQEYLAAYNMQGIINRCGVLTGPWQMGKVDQGFVVLWMARHFWKKGLAYIGYGGKGQQVRDILHIDDLYTLLSYQIDHLSELSSQTYNVGGGMALSVSLAELTEKCRAITGNSIPIESIPETRSADIPFYVSDCRKVRSETGWSPQKDIDTIIDDIYGWLRKNDAQLKPLLSQ